MAGCLQEQILHPKRFLDSIISCGVRNQIPEKVEKKLKDDKGRVPHIVEGEDVCVGGSVDLRQRFPELALCKLDWKADHIATDNYPSWDKNWSKSSQKALVPTIPYHMSQANACTTICILPRKIMR
jgi:hypothetical protein